MSYSSDLILLSRSAIACVLIAHNTVAQQSAFIALNNNDLYSVDTRNCSVSYVGTTDHGFVDIALTPSGELFGINPLGLYLIDTITANETFIGMCPAAGNSLVALNDSVLLTEHAGVLWGVSSLDASAWLIDTIGYYGTGDLAWFANDLYFSAYYMLIRINLLPNTAGVASLDTMTSLGTMGMVPGYLDAIRSSLVGFGGTNMFCLSPLDGSYNYVCNLILPDVVIGAASYQLPPTPLVGCGGENAIEQVPDNPRIHVRDQGGSIYVTWNPGTTYMTWSLFDSCGRSVGGGTIDHATRQLSISTEGLSTGVYILTLAAESRRTTRRFIKPQ